MNVSVQKKNLAYGLSVVSRAVASRSTLPVLGNILIASDEGRLRLSATNLEMGITCWVDAEIQTEGATTVPARTFKKLVNILPDQPVVLSLKKEALTMQGGKISAQVNCMSAEEFPPIPVGEESPNSIVINVGDFKEIVQQVAFAASKDEERQILTGVLVQVDGDTITLTATDGFRLSVRTAKLATPAGTSLRVVVPAQALREVARVAKDGDKTLTVMYLEKRNQIIFRLKNIEVFSEVINGKYPDVSKFIPNGYKTRAILSTQDFLDGCKPLKNLSHICLRITPRDDGEPGVVEILGELDEAKIRVPIVAQTDGKPIDIFINVKWVIEMLRAFHHPNVVLEATESTAPCVFRDISINDGQFLHVIMPMKKPE